MFKIGFILNTDYRINITYNYQKTSDWCINGNERYKPPERFLGCSILLFD